MKLIDWKLCHLTDFGQYNEETLDRVRKIDAALGWRSDIPRLQTMYVKRFPEGHIYDGWDTGYERALNREWPDPFCLVSVARMDFLRGFNAGLDKLERDKQNAHNIANNAGG
jgi:hypothetical protein